MLLLLPLVALAGSAQAAPVVDLQPLRGQVVYLDFWASWCVPCRQSFPWMEAAQAAHASGGLKVIAVSVDTQRADADRFLSRMPHTFDIRFDPQGTLAEQYHLQGMPSSLLIDRRGVVRYTHVGFRPGDDARLEAQLRLLLAEP
jgi:thiol-disulfide isomerase/thioredoxin